MALAAEHAAVNLGVGMPDFDGPSELLDAAVQAIRGGANQYSAVDGRLELRAAIAEHAERSHGQPVDPATMVTVTSGATEAILDTVLALVDPGDRVVCFEPLYDAYAAGVAIAGGRIDAVPLCPPDAHHDTWWFRETDLAAAFTDRTRLAILNTPHNPTGKVFTRAELEAIAALCIRWRVPVLVDEVYEHIVFDAARHVRLGCLDGMRPLAITLGSCSKSFSVTGWRIGWAIAAPDLTTAIRRIHQYTAACAPAPLQLAAAHALRLPPRYFDQLRHDYARRRARLHRVLDRAGLSPLPCEGTFYSLVDVSSLGFASDHQFCRMLVERIGVAAIPLSPFLSRPDALGATQLVRFAFCKRDDTLDAAGERLRRLRSI